MNDQQNTACGSRQSEINEQLATYESLITQLEGAVSRIAARLSDVLRAEPPSDPADCKAMELHTSMGSRLNNLNGAVNSNIVALESICDRIEV